MILSSEDLDDIRLAAESVNYGKVILNINEAGPYLEITVENRIRKPKSKDTSFIEGRVKVYRTDVK
jgi:hypothetical protein